MLALQLQEMQNYDAWTPVTKNYEDAIFYTPYNSTNEYVDIRCHTSDAYITFSNLRSLLRSKLIERCTSYITCITNDQIILWNAVSGTCLRRIPNAGYITAIFLNSQQLALGGSDITVINLRKSSETFSLLGKSGYAFNGLLLLRPGLLISAASNQISSWDLETKSIQDECYIFGNKHMERISDTMFATLGATSATIQLWNDKLQKTGSKIFPYSNILQSVSYIGNNRLLVGIANSEAILWNFEHKNTEKLDETLPHWSVRKVSNCIVAADKNSISILKMESLRKLKMINDACTDGETVIQVAELENKIVYMNKEHNLVLVDLEGRVLQTYKGCSNIATRITTI